MFGKNTTGGAVNVITKRPGPDFEANAVVRVGDFDQRDARVSVNLPVIDEKLFIRGALALEHDDGYYTEVTTGRGYQDNELRALYLSTRWLANEHWTVDFTGQYSERPRNGRGGNCDFTGRTRNNGARHESGGGGDYEAACNASRDAGPYSFISEFEGFRDFTSTGLFGIATWDSIGPTGKLDNASVKISAAFRETTHQVLAERDYTAERLQSFGSFISPSGKALGRETEAKNMEALFQGTALDGRLDFTLGYNYFEDQGSPEGDDCVALYGTVAGTGQSVTCSNPGGRYDEILPFNITGMGPTPSGSQVFARNTSNAVFFHGAFDLSESLFLELGGRWTSEKREFRAIDWSPAGVLLGRDNLLHELNDNTVFVFEQDNDRSDVFTPMASISRRLPTRSLGNLDEGILYFSYSEGFNSGGFNYGIPQDILAAFYAYDPEEVKAYELGFKSTWGGGKLRFNIAAFLTDYTDKQVLNFLENGDELFGDPFFGFTDNIAEVQITGLEIETQLRTDSGFVFQAAASYLKNEFSEYSSFDPGQGLIVDVSDFNIEDLTPDYTLNATAQYTFNLNGGSTLTPRVGVYWQDGYDYGRGLTNDSPPSGCFQESYSKFNARLTWRSRDGDRQLALFGTNIGDELIQHFCRVSSVTGRSVQFKAPARWGIEATFLFGQ
jgi:iron complex outermembrane receptor protein